MKRRNGSARKILILAGPNGAGKTTFAEQFLHEEAQCLEFVNADLIARGLSPFAPTHAEFMAGRIMLSRIASLARSGESFAFETTLSGLGYARLIPSWRAVGYHVKLVFLDLADVEISLSRIRARVRLGGHDVPEPVVRRRFARGRDHFDRVYRSLVDHWALYENSGPTPLLIASGVNP